MKGVYETRPSLSKTSRNLRCTYCSRSITNTFNSSSGTYTKEFDIETYYALGTCLCAKVSCKPLKPSLLTK